MPVDTPERCKSLHGNDFASEPARDSRSRGPRTLIFTHQSTTGPPARGGRPPDKRRFYATWSRVFWTSTKSWTAIAVS